MNYDINTIFQNLLGISLPMNIDYTKFFVFIYRRISLATV
jgi:hypothetical protein